jgi:transposase
VFVVALGASNYTYPEACWTQGLAEWLASHINAFAFSGASPDSQSATTLRPA